MPLRQDTRNIVAVRWDFNIYLLNSSGRETHGSVYRMKAFNQLQMRRLACPKKLKNISIFLPKTLAISSGVVYTTKACVRR